MAGQAKENLPGGNLKYQFVYLKVRIFKCSYIYIYILYLSSQWEIHYDWGIYSSFLAKSVDCRILAKFRHEFFFGPMSGGNICRGPFLKFIGWFLLKGRFGVLHFYV